MKEDIDVRPKQQPTAFSVLVVVVISYFIIASIIFQLANPREVSFFNLMMPKMLFQGSKYWLVSTGVMILAIMIRSAKLGKLFLKNIFEKMCVMIIAFVGLGLFVRWMGNH